MLIYPPLQCNGSSVPAAVQFLLQMWLFRPVKVRGWDLQRWTRLPQSAEYYDIREILLEKMRRKHDERQRMWRKSWRSITLASSGTKLTKCGRRPASTEASFVLSDGLIGMGPMVMEADDMVVILRGGPEIGRAHV